MFLFLIQFLLDFFEILTLPFNQIRYKYALKKAILKKFPDAKRGYKSTNLFDNYSNESWNSNYVYYNYTRVEILPIIWPALVINLIHDFQFVYKNEIITIPIYSSPRDIYLAQIKSPYTPIGDRSGMTEMYFSHIDLQHTCYNEIINFIKKHPNYQMDTTCLDPKIKKMLTFI